MSQFYTPNNLSKELEKHNEGDFEFLLSCCWERMTKGFEKKEIGKYLLRLESKYLVSVITGILLRYESLVMYGTITYDEGKKRELEELVDLEKGKIEKMKNIGGGLNKKEGRDLRDVVLSFCMNGYEEANCKIKNAADIALGDLRGRLMDSGYIGCVSLITFKNAFTGKKMNSKICWKKSISFLAYFINCLVELGLLDKREKWIRAAYCFDKEGKSIDNSSLNKANTSDGRLNKGVKSEIREIVGGKGIWDNYKTLTEASTAEKKTKPIQMENLTGMAVNY